MFTIRRRSPKEILKGIFQEEEEQSQMEGERGRIESIVKKAVNTRVDSMIIGSVKQY